MAFTKKEYEFIMSCFLANLEIVDNLLQSDKPDDIQKARNSLSEIIELLKKYTKS